MIDRREILEAASSFSLLPGVVEKDYTLGWILAGIYAHEELAESWVFKGGTCLKKCYFETYRFSEDLDFTLREEGHLDEEFLQTVFEEVIAWVAEQSGLNLPADQLDSISTTTLADAATAKAKSPIAAPCLRLQVVGRKSSST
jgi:predicted nucleotidyltransferase component of viral defense system